jgi:hypothetical protein
LADALWLVDHFGYSGKVEAQKMPRSAAPSINQRLLGAFNVDVDNWSGFLHYTDFVDRDGKFQLQMLKYSAFAPRLSPCPKLLRAKKLPHGHRKRWAAADR